MYVRFGNPRQTQIRVWEWIMMLQLVLSICLLVSGCKGESFPSKVTTVAGSEGTPLLDSAKEICYYDGLTYQEVNISSTHVSTGYNLTYKTSVAEGNFKTALTCRETESIPCQSNSESADSEPAQHAENVPQHQAIVEEVSTPNSLHNLNGPEIVFVTEAMPSNFGIKQTEGDTGVLDATPGFRIRDPGSDTLSRDVSLTPHVAQTGKEQVQALPETEVGPDKAVGGEEAETSTTFAVEVDSEQATDSAAAAALSTRAAVAASAAFLERLDRFEAVLSKAAEVLDGLRVDLVAERQNLHKAAGLLLHFYTGTGLDALRMDAATGNIPAGGGPRFLTPNAEEEQGVRWAREQGNSRTGLTPGLPVDLALMPADQVSGGLKGSGRAVKENHAAAEEFFEGAQVAGISSSVSASAGVGVGASEPLGNTVGKASGGAPQGLVHAALDVSPSRRSLETLARVFTTKNAVSFEGQKNPVPLDPGDPASIRSDQGEPPKEDGLLPAAPVTCVCSVEAPVSKPSSGVFKLFEAPRRLPPQVSGLAIVGDAAGRFHVTDGAGTFTQTLGPATPPSSRAAAAQGNKNIKDDDGCDPYRRPPLAVHDTGAKSAVTVCMSYPVDRGEIVVVTGHASGEVRAHRVKLQETVSDAHPGELVPARDRPLRSAASKIPEPGSEADYVGGPRVSWSPEGYALYSWLGGYGIGVVTVRPLYVIPKSDSQHGVSVPTRPSGAAVGQGNSTSDPLASGAVSGALDSSDTAGGRENMKESKGGYGNDDGLDEPAVRRFGKSAVLQLLSFRLGGKAMGLRQIIAIDAAGQLAIRRENGTLRQHLQAAGAPLAAKIVGDHLIVISRRHASVVPSILNGARGIRSFACEGLLGGHVPESDSDSGSKSLGNGGAAALTNDNDEDRSDVGFAAVAFDPKRAYRAYALSHGGELLTLVTPHATRLSICKVVQRRILRNHLSPKAPGATGADARDLHSKVSSLNSAAPSVPSGVPLPPASSLAGSPGSFPAAVATKETLILWQPDKGLTILNTTQLRGHEGPAETAFVPAAEVAALLLASAGVAVAAESQSRIQTVASGGRGGDLSYYSSSSSSLYGGTGAAVSSVGPVAEEARSPSHLPFLHGAAEVNDDYATDSLMYYSETSNLLFFSCGIIAHPRRGASSLSRTEVTGVSPAPPHPPAAASPSVTAAPPLMEGWLVTLSPVTSKLTDEDGNSSVSQTRAFTQPVLIVIFIVTGAYQYVKFTRKSMSASGARRSRYSRRFSSGKSVSNLEDQVEEIVKSLSKQRGEASRVAERMGFGPNKPTGSTSRGPAFGSYGFGAKPFSPRAVGPMGKGRSGRPRVLNFEGKGQGPDRRVEEPARAGGGAGRRGSYPEYSNRPSAGDDYASEEEDDFDAMDDGER